jgi:hypothetical protein
MSKLWEVAFEANPFYLVEADTAEEAVNKALNWYDEYEPKISCALHSSSEDDDLYFEEEDEEPCCADCDHYGSHGDAINQPCMWCEEYSEFERKRKNW